jgi:hypothetical protein
MNNMGREIMAALKRFQVGSDGDGVTVGGALVVSGATTANTFSATAVNATGTVTFSGSVILSGTTTANTFSTDLITEKTSAAGVTVDGVLLKDSQVTTDQINEKTSAAGVTIDSVLLKDGTVKATTTISVGNATPAASGAGITFPATVSASSDANTLDDYEEGTWTPTVTAATPPTGVTYGTQAATYTKIGRFVFVQVFVQLNGKGSGGSGAIRIAGLPFTSNSSASALQSALNECLDVTMPANRNNLITRLNQNSSSLAIEFFDTRASQTSNGGPEVAYSEIGASFRLIAGFCYQTS